MAMERQREVWSDPTALSTPYSVYIESTSTTGSMNELCIVALRSIMTTEREALRDLVARQAIVRGPFILSSGGVSPYYFDCKRLTLGSDGAWAVGHAVADEPERLTPRPIAI